MSHQVTIDFEGISIQVQSQCDVALHSLCKIDKALKNVKENASTLESTKVVEYENFLLDSKEKIQKEINSFTAKLEQYKKLKTYVGDPYYDVKAQEKIKLKDDILSKSKELMLLVNELTGAKLEVINELINELVNEGLLNAGNVAYKQMQDKMYGVIEFDEQLMKKVNSIEDVSLRELVYLEMLKDKNNKDFELLCKKGQEQYDILLGKAKDRIIEESKIELKSNGVSEKEIQEFENSDFNSETINALNTKVTQSITDEKIRKETLKVIIKAIRDRGFIVDTKKNLRIDKEKNIVKLVAKKADGKTAEFEIQLNGKFMYHFDGYDGMACKKDIEPFIEDLEKIYDINILHEEVQWSNPDKISTQKYQYINHNKGTN